VRSKIDFSNKETPMKKTPYVLALLTALAAFTALPSPVRAQVNAEITVGMAPPPFVGEEVIAPAPGPGPDWHWHKRHYRWIDGTYVLVPGHWVHEHAPRPEAVWVEPAWQPRGNGYVFVEGHWK
jgi:hypothetical protein